MPTYENAVKEITPNMAKMDRSPLKVSSINTKDYKYSNESIDKGKYGLMSTDRDLFNENKENFQHNQRTVEKKSREQNQFDRFQHDLPPRNRVRSGLKHDNY